ncbi:flagellar hook-associated protein FlgK [Streptomyces sp. NP160]|uniref:flagellar hook-associated protein FlgK n=1 Tax=Streptomyces sp. NP160 TaxID=2586637 RepID=UPI00111B9328|nr:flagellar hook-associated protein FlgK [Streptomyces sp. NP160]TNM69373.1 flagellar hook-associated protein FlgK [Streptomyces sp. NP160]
MSTFSGINAAVTALRAHRSAMDVIGQNVANVNTPGYTRQRAELEMLNAPGGSGMLTGNPVTGGGVRVAEITRAFDAVQSQRVNVQTGDHALQQQRADTLSGLESLTQEPSDAGLATQLNKMWAAFADAATKVGSTNADAAARQSVLGAAQNVVTTLHAAWNTINDQWSTMRTQVSADVDEVNTLAGSVATLNEQIQKAVTTGGAANELKDRRDQLVTRIVELTGATTQAAANGQTDLYLGGGLLVQGNLTTKLTVSQTPTSMTDVLKGQAAGATPAEVANGTIVVKLGDNTVTPFSGKITGELEALRTTLPGASAKYDAVAQSLATQVNALQTATTAVDGNGVTPPKKLFSGDVPAGTFTAQSITIDTSFTSKDLALGSVGKGVKDGSNAAAIAAVGTSATSPDSVWASYVSKLGADSASAVARTTSAQAVLTASIADQQGAAGVSLDEESADLIAAQRAYQGAARVLTAVDEMLDTLINKTGLVGR